MSEFEQFFKNSKIRKLQVLCAITFGGIATHLKVIVAFKSQKIMFFEGLDKASISMPNKSWPVAKFWPRDFEIWPRHLKKIWSWPKVLATSKP